MRHRLLARRVLGQPARHVRVVGAALAAGLIITSFVSLDDADAARRRRRRGRALAVQLINLDGRSNVPGNAVVEVVFNTKVREDTINHSQFQVREQNATQTGFTKQIFGNFQYLGNVVRFYPRLPTHLRDPSSPTNDFYPFGAQQDNASENAGLQPAKNYQIRLLGKGSIAPLRSSRGRVLRKNITANFTTAAATDPEEHFTTTTYTASPPPRFAFSNPPDKTPGAQSDQYAARGGAPGVASDTDIAVFCTNVPIAPTTARIQGNISLMLLERDGDPSIRRPIDGVVFLEQNFNTTLLVFKPHFPLPDRSTVGLRITKNVLDLTEQFDFQPNRGRETLRAIYDWLTQARAGNPGLPADQLDDPPVNLIGDWPPASDTIGRGILKTNMLDLGDNRPDEIDPRIHVLFRTRDELVTNAELVINFTRAENLYDGTRSTAEWDGSVPSAAAAILTIAAGSAADGDFKPTTDVTLNMDTYADSTANFRDVVIPQGVVVTLVGSRPATIKAVNMTVSGTIDGSGRNGTDAVNQSNLDTSTPARRLGALGNLGGGKGGDTATTFPAGGTPPTTHSATENVRGTGYAGSPGHDFDGVVAAPDDGGRGGLSSRAGIGSAYNLTGGGGGGGARTAGGTGDANPYRTTAWNGTGGVGGAGSTNDDVDPLVGGGGGGPSANGAYHSENWKSGGASGASGGGAIRLQAARVIVVSSTGILRARGGVGAKGNTAATWTTGASGGGGGGTVHLRSFAGFNIADPSSIDVRGGAGGVNPNVQSWVAINAGGGGDGYIRLDDPNGGVVLPSGTAGLFDPVGGGVPSFVWSKFADLGVDGTRILNFTNSDIVTNPTTNDAILIEMQMTREHPSIFGEPDLTALNSFGDTTNPGITSDWRAVKIHDNTDSVIPAFVVPGWDKGTDGAETTFPIEDLTGQGFRFARFRIFFQLDDFHSRLDPLPFVDKITMHFQFNF